MSVQGIIGVIDIDRKIVDFLSLPDVLACREASRSLKSITEKTFGWLCQRDFKKILACKVIEKTVDMLGYEDYRILYLYSKQATANNAKRGRCGIGPSAFFAHPQWNFLFGYHSQMTVKSQDGDSFAFYLPKQGQQAAGRVIVLRMDGTEYTFDVLCAATAVHVIGYTVFVFQQQNSGSCFVNLYDCRDGRALLESPYRWRKCAYMRSGDQFIFWDISQMCLQSVDCIGDRKEFFRCSSEACIIAWNQLDEDHFSIKMMPNEALFDMRRMHLLDFKGSKLLEENVGLKIALCKNSPLYQGSNSFYPQCALTLVDFLWFVANEVAYSPDEEMIKKHLSLIPSQVLAKISFLAFNKRTQDVHEEGVLKNPSDLLKFREIFASAIRSFLQSPREIEVLHELEKQELMSCAAQIRC